MLAEQDIVSDWVNMYKEKGKEAIKVTYSREAYKHHDDKVLEKQYKKSLEDLQITKAENERRIFIIKNIFIKIGIH